MSTPPKIIFGHLGETKAAAFLRQQGWQILATNVRCGQYELDIVAFDPHYQETVFVEVKTRRHDFSGDPADAVDARKFSAFITAGTHYADCHHLKTDYRFDIIAVTPDKIEHFENITFP